LDSELHGWDLSPREAADLQKTLARAVVIRPLPSRIRVIGASDISYSKQSETLIAVIVTFRWPGLEPMEVVHHVSRASFPYVPGLLAFREAPPLIEAYRKIKMKPAVLLCDGQGIAHPKRMGLAAHLGLFLGIPTVGCAKSRLCGEHENLTLRKGFSKPLMLGAEQVGVVFCSRDGVKPIYISPGHLADIFSSKRIVSRCLRRFRVPEPLRLAHIEANRIRIVLANEGST
jgi:deoxyribonuclease V